MKGLGLLLAQTVCTAAVTVAGLLFALGSGQGAWYSILMWGLIPALSAVSAYLVTRRGVNAYLAWPLPAAASVAAHWAFLGYPPGSAGMPIVAALAALVAAAAGDVKNRMDGKRHKR